MDFKTKMILEKQLTISQIEKTWNCTTDRAVTLFCKALGIKKPNTDKLDAWSKQKLKVKSQQVKEKINKCIENEGEGGCASCHSCPSSCKH